MSEAVEKNALVPKLRFPGFSGEWDPKKLSSLTSEVSEAVGERALVPVSISAGKGFVPQAQKFGRDISGDQYRRYTVVSAGTFVYNRGNSLSFPQGCVYRFLGKEPVAAPAVFTCFRPSKSIMPELLEQFFAANLHGKQLKRVITSSARSNGLLNISDKEFFSIVVPLPGKEEQRKIAECLQSLDELIAAQMEKLEALKRHKKGLLQQLFPAEGETIPRLRFPQFREADDWQDGSIADIGKVVTGTTPTTTRRELYGHDIPFVSPADISDDHFVTSAKSGLTILGATYARVVPAGSTFFVCIGSTIGKLAQCSVESATNQQINTVVPDTKRFDPGFVYYLLSTQVDTIRQIAGKQAVPLVNKTDFSSVPVLFPLIEEQRSISRLLSELDNAQNATSHNIATLRLHKSALMQQLFPHVEELEQ